jgi:hypothetical protein
MMGAPLEVEADVEATSLALKALQSVSEPATGRESGMDVEAPSFPLLLAWQAILTAGRDCCVKSRGEWRRTLRRRISKKSCFENLAAQGVFSVGNVLIVHLVSAHSHRKRLGPNIAAC